MRTGNLLHNPMLLLTAVLLSGAAAAVEPTAPAGSRQAAEITYKPHKVVYDVAVDDLAAIDEVLDRVSHLNNIYQADPFEAGIVLVLHGDEIPFFAIVHHEKYRDLVQRAHSLTLAGPISFRICRAAARMRGFEPDAFHEFIGVVPMADAEIVRLQQEEHHAYMR